MNLSNKGNKGSSGGAVPFSMPILTALAGTGIMPSTRSFFKPWTWFRRGWRPGYPKGLRKRVEQQRAARVRDRQSEGGGGPID